VSQPIAMLPIPDYGEQCNGCGYCCRAELCGLAMEVLKTKAQYAPCPFLVERDGRTWCGVVEAAAKENEAFGAHLAWRLGFGTGCQIHPLDSVRTVDAVATPTAEGKAVPSRKKGQP
jgi:hypothetical protein